MSQPPNIPVHPDLDFLPESVIALYRELQNHHKHLFAKYDNLASLWGTPESLGILAAEVNIAVNGEFNDKAVDHLAGMITARLVARRSGTKEVTQELILPPGFKRELH